MKFSIHYPKGIRKIFRAVSELSTKFNGLNNLIYFKLLKLNGVFFDKIAPRFHLSLCIPGSRI